MRNLFDKYKQWKNKRYWKKQQLEYLMVTLQQDHRWLANDKTADAWRSSQGALACLWTTMIIPVDKSVDNFR